MDIILLPFSITVSLGRTYERRTGRGPPDVGKHGEDLRRSSLCDLPPTPLAPQSPCGGHDQKSPPCWYNKRLQFYAPRHLVELAYCCRVFPSKLLRNNRYGALHLFAKTPRGDPTKFFPRQHCCLGMGQTEKRTHQTNENTPAAEVCASSTRFTFRRSAPPSTSLYSKQKPEPRIDAMAYAIAKEQRLLQFGETQTSPMEYAIATSQRIPQHGGQSPRSRDSRGRPRRFTYKPELQIREL